jgi:hypothetical protein
VEQKHEKYQQNTGTDLSIESYVKYHSRKYCMGYKLLNKMPKVTPSIDTYEIRHFVTRYSPDKT